MLQPRLAASLLLLQLIWPTALGACPTGWQSYKGNCYFFAQSKWTYTAADSACKSRNSNLVSMKTKDEYKYLQDTLNRINSGQHYWTGLSDLTKEGTYVFSDNTKYDKNQISWNSGEPRKDNNKDCAWMIANSRPKYLLQINQCRLSGLYICKRSETLRDMCDTGSGWHAVENRCYRFFTDRLNWFNARAACQTQGADLLVINSEAEKSFVSETITCQGSDQNTMWLGFSDTVKKAFGWVDKTKPADTLLNWDGKKQPAQADPKGDNCAIVFSYNQFKWTLDSCSTSEMRYICEKAQGSCPKGWLSGKNGKCYQLQTRATNWIDAVETCKNYAKTSTMTAFEDGELTDTKAVPGSILKQLGNRFYWIGVSDQGNDGTFKRVDGLLPKTTVWNKGVAPAGIKGRLDCGAIAASDQKGLWQVVFCFKNLQYICQMDLSDNLSPVTTPDYGHQGCVNGWVLNPRNMQCYRFIDDEKTWADAKDDCASQQGWLATIVDEYEQSFLSKNMKSSAYVSLTDVAKINVWIDSKGKTATFFNWRPREPNGRDRENCVEIVQGGDRGGWNDIMCSAKRDYICQTNPVDGGTTPKLIIPPTPPYSSLCGADWTFDSVSGRCYYLSDDQKPWVDARMACQAKDSELLSLGTYAEQMFVQGVLTQKVGVLQYWIGAHDRSTEGGWEWSDGSPFSYLNWNDGEPNDKNAEDCVELSNLAEGRWNDASCSTLYNYICKKRGRNPYADFTTTAAPVNLVQPSTNCSGLALLSGAHWVSDSQLRGVKASDQSTDQASGPENSRIDWDVFSTSPYTYMNTTKTYGYKPVPNLDLRTVTSITFTVRACNDAHISLQPTSDSVDANSYEIIIGGWTNSKSVIHRQHLKNVLKEASGALLDCNVDKQFWLSWGSQTIAVGSGTSVGSNIIVQFTDDKPYTVRTVAVTTGWNADGYWVFKNPKVRRTGAWIPSAPGNSLEVDFGKPVIVQSLATRGRSDSPSWVTSYTIKYKYDAFTLWESYNVAPKFKTIKVFSGNSNQDATVTNNLTYPITARWIRITPTEVHGGKGGLRWELYGCVSPEYCNPEALISGPSSIPPTQLTASSNTQLANNARFQGYRGAADPTGWVSAAGSQTDDTLSNEWLQVDLGRDKAIYGVQTRGSNTKENRWVTKYILAFREDKAKEIMYYQEPFGSVRVFSGNTDKDSVVTNALGIPIKARYIQFVPLKGNGKPEESFYMMVEVFGCSVECTAMALVDGAKPVDSSWLKASTVSSAYAGAARAKLSSVRDGSYLGAWRPKTASNSWVQVDFGTNQRIDAFSTKGRADADEWVSTYSLQFSSDGKSFYKYNKGQVFKGNWDRDTEVKYFLPKQVSTQTVRFIVLEFNKIAAMRFEVYGCEAPSVRSLGCFFKPLDTDTFTTIASTNPYVCGGRCFEAGYPYAGIRFRNCFCFSSRPATGESSNCDIKCGAASVLKCGGRTAGALSLYTTGRRADNARCADGYTEFNEKCYMISKVERTWTDSQRFCRSDGGDLVTINDLAVQSFIKAAVNQAKPPGGVWIGLSDIVNQMGFTWSDRSPVLKTFWNRNEPNNWLGSVEDCVELDKDHGLWNDAQCTDTRYSMCYKNKEKQPITTPAPPPKGCDQGWSAYDSYCFLFHEHYSTWSLAKTTCQKEGGQLVRIRDEFQQAFLTSQLYTRQQAQATGNLYWTDLRTFDGESYVYSTRSKTIVPYTHWDAGQPLDTYGSKGAVAMVSVNRQSTKRPNVGYWVVRSVSSGANIICEKPRTGFPVRPFPTLSPTDIDCPAGWVGVGSWCMQVNAGEVIQRKPWTDAQADCKAKGANLAYIQSVTENDIVWKQYLLGTTGNFWIGLNDREVRSGFVWASGEPATFVHWDTGEPNDWMDSDRPTGGDEACVELNAGSGKWNDKRCMAANNWICSIPRSKIQSLKDVSTTLAPTAGDPAQCTQDGSDWSYYGKKCYYLNNNAEDFYSARDICVGQGGDLVSISNINEQNFVASLAKKAFTDPRGINAYGLAGSQVEVWIGLNELATKNGHRWSDGNPLTYTKWEANEPNDWEGGEYCVGMRARTGLWNDEHCGSLYPFVCEKYKDRTTGTPPAPTKKIPGFCPQGYVDFKNNCYKISLSNNKNVNWTTAEKNCEDDSGHLVSILDEQEQDFLTSQLLVASTQYKTNVWIGMFFRAAGSVAEQRVFAWDDNQAVSWTNWNRGEPNGRRIDDSESGKSSEMCVEMLTDPPGVWNDASCDSQLGGYICKKLKTGNDQYRQTTPSSLCPAGRDYTAFGSVCFRLVNSAKPWIGAENECAKDDGAHLATIFTSYELAYISSLLRAQNYNSGNKVWIGLKSASSTYELFKWVSDWPLSLTNWASGEPGTLGDDDGCVQMDPKSGEWSHVDCSAMNFYVCSYTSGHPAWTAPTNGFCESTQGEVWSPLNNGYCYLVGGGGDQGFTQDQALRQCKGRSAEIVSIHSDPEVSLLHTMMQNRQINAVWTGLVKKATGGYAWEDGSSVGFAAWAKDEPNGKDSERCVEMRRNGEWNDLPCSAQIGFACRIKQGLIPTLDPTLVPPPTTSTLSPTPVPLCQGAEWTFFNEVCYLVVTDEPLNFREASGNCQIRGGNLITVRSPAVQQFMENTLLPMTQNADEPWIGISETAADNRFGWEDGTYSGYRNWDQDAHEPNTNWGSMDCAAVKIDSQKSNYGTWATRYCYNKKPYICQIDSLQKPRHLVDVPTTTGNLCTFPFIYQGQQFDTCTSYGSTHYWCSRVPNFDEDGNDNNFLLCNPLVCPAGWQLGGKKCYKFSTDYKTWSDASSYCVQQGGHLANITSPSEQGYISDYIDSFYWIGLTDLDQERRFEWNIGSDAPQPMVFTNWNEGEPRNSWGSEDCVIAKGGEFVSGRPGAWIVQDCAFSRRYICEKTPVNINKLPTLPPSTSTTVAPATPKASRGTTKRVTDYAEPEVQKQQQNDNKEMAQETLIATIFAVIGFLIAVVFVALFAYTKMTSVPKNSAAFSNVAFDNAVFRADDSSVVIGAGDK